LKDVLFLVTDSPYIRPLQYVVDEFCRIQKAEFSINVLFSEDIIDINLYKHRIYHSPFKKGSELWATENYYNDLKITWQKENYYSYSNCIGEDGKIDLLWASFLFLSRFEEFKSEKEGKFINSNFFNHPRQDKKSFQFPIVNIYFNQFEEIIQSKYPNLIFSKGDKPILEFSHDLDYITKTIQLRLKQTAFNTFNSIRLLGQNGFFNQITNTLKFFFSNPNYWTFDYWKSIEERFEKKSTFYIYSKVKKSSIKLWLLDPSYDVSNNLQLQTKLKELLKDGFKIGLHGSFNSANDFNLLKKEKEKLENALNVLVNSTRQHWLRYREEETPYIHSRLFDFDSTHGFNDIFGFRAGCASVYKPFNHLQQNAFNHFEIPQFLMDSNFYDYGKLEMKLSYESIFSILDNLSNYKSVYISISWHPHTNTSDYNWHKLYEEILAYKY